MNAVAEILTYAEQHGISLFAENGRLILEGTSGSLAPEFVEQAKQHKQELLLLAPIKKACHGLTITPEQFLVLTSEEDRALIQDGIFFPECLRAYAESFAEGIQSRRIVFHPATGKLLHHN